MLRDLQTMFKRWWRSTPPALPIGPATVAAAALPAWVTADPLVQKYTALLGALPWADCPERPADRPWPGPQPHPRAPFVAAFLIKLHEDIRFMADLRTFLIEHPALVVWLGFPRVPDPASPHGINVAATVPDRRQFSRVLRTLPPATLAWLLTASVHLLQATLPADQQATFGDTIAGDTQALLAWVKENNPKQFIKAGRLDKTRQPSGDPDCKLGVKKRRNVSPEDAPPTPTTAGQPANRLQVGVDIFWGYAAGIVVTALPDGTEIVLAERTRPFNESDISYFPPLMAQVEQQLGRRPRTGIWDTAFDAHYVYDYYHQAGGQAIVPLNRGKRGGDRQFDADGQPLCAAGLGMPVRFTFQDRTSTLVPHERATHGCPLLHPTPTGQVCPIADPHWEKGGCTTTLATGAGARLRLQIDRDTAAYKQLYAQRTMVERVNSQAEALGLLRPTLRSGRAIANQASLTYVLINLRALRRVVARSASAVPPSA